MPMKDYFYHGQAFGVDADITNPGPYKLDGHAKCALPDGKAGHYTGSHPGFTMPSGLSHGACATEVDAKPEDKNGFFRTEVRATVENLRVDGKSVLTVDRIVLGMVTVYRRGWYDRPGPHARRTRVLPLDCSFVNLTLNGTPLPAPLPPPFHYSADQREAYLAGDDPDPKIDAEVRQAIIGSPSRCIYLRHFGRIFFGEWTIVPGENWHSVHQIAMLRFAFSSPPSGGGTGGGTQGGGTGG
ncbi:MAG TPA: hypothetical protein VN924_21965 [Bryobacteraceae bacterium]|jgi:hypothetical protein|nr:hypothetical protein [Bryobacteraceae bacterium]